MTAVPSRLKSDIDLFSDAVLENPFPYYKQLRDLGPTAYLARHDVWFLGRYDEARRALTDWKRFSSAQGIGLNDTINAAWKDALICADPPVHTQKRRLIMEKLGPKYLKPVEDTIAIRARELAARLAERQEFDGVADLAHELPVNVIMDLIGWPDDVRGHLLDFAIGSWNAVGPENERMRASLPKLAAMMEMIGRVYDEGRLTPDGFGSAMVNAAKRGDINREEAIGLLAGYVVAAFETTISAMASGVYFFALYPDQWDLVRKDVSLVPKAFNEIIRMETPIQNFSRVVTEDIDLGEDAVIPEGARVIVSYASANRDERHFETPDRFDVLRKETDHLGFGLGNHSCAGQGLARLEGHAVFTELAKVARGFELTGEPSRELNNIARAFASLPARVLV
jgi:cytochrome P450